MTTDPTKRQEHNGEPAIMWTHAELQWLAELARMGCQFVTACAVKSAERTYAQLFKVWRVLLQITGFVITDFIKMGKLFSSDIRFSQLWLWRWPPSGLQRPCALV
jgi:hypothetical protein